jgi:hypothetical protein
MASKSLQRKKPGYTKNGDVKIVSLNGQQLTKLLDSTSKPKIKAKIQRRIQDLGYVAPVVVDTPAENVVQ